MEKRHFNSTTVLSLFMSESSRESFIGDLEERFQRIASRTSILWATIWYCKQIVLLMAVLVLHTLRYGRYTTPQAYWRLLGSLAMTASMLLALLLPHVYF